MLSIQAGLANPNIHSIGIVGSLNHEETTPPRALKALAVFSTVLITPVLLTGCPDQIEGHASCGGNGFDITCSEWGASFIWEQNLFDAGNSGKLRSGFDVSQMSADFSQSSSDVMLTTNNGYAVVKLALSTGSVVTNAFPWVRQGDLIVAQNPSAVNNWVDSYRGDITEVEVDLGAISASGGEGANTLVGEAVSSGTAYAGIARSWYNNQKCDPSDPFGQCQID